MFYRGSFRYVLLLIAVLTCSGCPFKADGPATETVNLAITKPTEFSSVDTSDTSVRLAGTATSNTPITEVSWTNDRGGKGIASGTESWQTGKINLKLGQNRLVVTAEDMAGKTTSRSIVFNRESGQTGSTTLAWAPPTSRVDGSPLTNLAGYKIFYGRMAGVYDYEIEIDNPGVVTYVVDELVSGDWYFALAAFDSNGLESNRSNEVSRKIS